jgi:hypothetical protein
MSPALSGTVLPCSSDSMRASSSLFCWTRSTNFIITRARTWGFFAAQPGCAAAAFSTASRSSCLLARATFAWTSPVLGLKTSPNRPLWPLTARPPMKCPISFIYSFRPRLSAWRAPWMIMAGGTVALRYQPCKIADQDSGRATAGIHT